MSRLFNSVSRVFFGEQKPPGSSDFEDNRNYSMRDCSHAAIGRMLGLDKQTHSKSKKSLDVKRSRSTRAGGSRASKVEKEMYVKRPVFGVPLKHVEMSKKYPNVPRFVVDCIEYIENHYIRNDGIYRVSGKAHCVSKLQEDLNTDYNASLFKTAEANTLMSLLKVFFRDMTESIIPLEACNIYLLKSKTSNRVQCLRALVNDMREPNRTTLRFLIRHLANVATQSTWNRMSAYNLATVWGPSILWVQEISEIRITIEIVRILILNYATIFKDVERKQTR